MKKYIAMYEDFKARNEAKGAPALKDGEIVSTSDPAMAAEEAPLLTSDAAKSKSDKKDTKKDSKTDAKSGAGASSGDTSGASSGDSDVRSPTSTRTEVRSPTSTETSTDAYTSGNVTVTGGAGDGDTVVHIHSNPEEQKRLATPKKKDLPAAIAMPGPNDKKSY